MVRGAWLSGQGWGALAEELYSARPSFMWEETQLWGIGGPGPCFPYGENPLLDLQAWEWVRGLGCATNMV